MTLKPEKHKINTNQTFRAALRNHVKAKPAKNQRGIIMEEKRAVTMDKLVNLCKARGIIFPGSDIYGGMGNTWDYGPVGVEIKNNIKRAWWKKFVQESENSYGVDAAILMNSRVWEASGHTASFSDPKMDCKE